jgi:hypothetical protein
MHSGGYAKLFISTNRLIMISPYLAEDRSIQFVEPSLLCERQAANRASGLLHQDHITIVHPFEGCAPNPAEAGFHRLSAIKNERQERLIKNGEMQSDLA